VILTDNIKLLVTWKAESESTRCHNAKLLYDKCVIIQSWI